MEFKDVENILKHLVVKVKDIIKLQELLHSMENLTIQTKEGIQAQINNHGQAYAAMDFFDSVRKKPGCFPKMVAALKHIGQEDIYDIFINEIRTYFRCKQTKLAIVLSLIHKEEQEFGIADDHDDDEATNHSSTSGASANYRAPSNDLSKDKYTMANQPGLQTPAKANTTLSSSSALSPPVSSPDNNNPPGATGCTGHVYGNQPASPPLQIHQRYAGSRISDLKAKVYEQLGKALDETFPEGDECWWKHMIIEGNLDISRKQLKEIEMKKSPGVELLDCLDSSGYTLGDLETLLTKIQMEEALNILREHQNNVIHTDERRRGDLQSEQNNFNSSQGIKPASTKDMNIVAVVQTGVPEEQNRPSIEPPQPSDNIDSSRDFSSTLLTIQDSSLSSCQSLEDNTRIIEDTFIKGTTAVQAHGDPTGKKSEPNPEQDALKLREDRVHQFDNDPDALERISFLPVDRDRTVDHDRDIGNMPLFSQLDSTEPRSEELPRDVHIAEPPREVNIEVMPREQVIAVVPRNIGNEEIAEPVDDPPYTTRVMCVDPNISSAGSMEVPDNITSIGQNSTSDFQSESMHDSANSLSGSNLL